jgi:hypothetical protein
MAIREGPKRGFWGLWLFKNNSNFNILSIFARQVYFSSFILSPILYLKHIKEILIKQPLGIPTKELPRVDEL